MSIEAVRYEGSMKQMWDDAVKTSRNATFLFERDFMDYHQDRFTDASLLFVNDKGKIRGLFPANILSDKRQVDSHGGLTYGGLLLSERAESAEVAEMFKALVSYYRSLNCISLKYKPIPHIYHCHPAEEECYFLFRAGAVLQSRALSSAINLRHPLPFNNLHLRKYKNAQRRNLQIKETVALLPEFWEILQEVLMQRHSVTPVHSLIEIRKLAMNFPDHIKLYTVSEDSGEVIAGSLLFLTQTTIHVQYIATNDVGREYAALDWLFHYLIKLYSNNGKHSFFDFGISTENEGQTLNRGLVFQKEGLGGRAICYDTYILNLDNNLLL